MSTGKNEMGRPIMHAVVFATTLAALIAIHAPAAAQTASAPLEKKNYNHSAWTKGIFSDAVTVTELGAGKWTSRE